MPIMQSVQLQLPDSLEFSADIQCGRYPIVAAYIFWHDNFLFLMVGLFLPFV